LDGNVQLSDGHNFSIGEESGLISIPVQSKNYPHCIHIHPQVHPCLSTAISPHPVDVNLP